MGLIMFHYVYYHSDASDISITVVNHYKAKHQKDVPVVKAYTRSACIMFVASALSYNGLNSNVQKRTQKEERNLLLSLAFCLSLSL